MPVRKNRFKAIADSIVPAIADGITTSAGFIADVERQLVPVDEGDLQGTIRVVSTGPTSAQVLAGDPNARKRDGRPVDYVAFVEYGSDDSGAQPFITPAATAIRPEVEVRRQIRARIKG